MKLFLESYLFLKSSLFCFSGIMSKINLKTGDIDSSFNGARGLSFFWRFLFTRGGWGMVSSRTILMAIIFSCITFIWQIKIIRIFFCRWALIESDQIKVRLQPIKRCSSRKFQLKLTHESINLTHHSSLYTVCRK